MVIVRQTEQINEEEVGGEWYTEGALALLPGWDAPGSLKCYFALPDLRSMASAAANWARARGFARKSEIHQKEEFRVPTKERFALVNRERSSQTASGSGVVENGGALLASAPSLSQLVGGTLGFFRLCKHVHLGL